MATCTHLDQVEIIEPPDQIGRHGPIGEAIHQKNRPVGHRPQQAVRCGQIGFARMRKRWRQRHAYG